MTRSTKIKHARIDPADKLARKLDLPESQIGRGNLAVRDVVNHSEKDQRHAVRAKATETVRRLTRIERLVKLQIIDRDQAAACQWYSDAHELGFVASLGCTANYGGAGGGGCTSFDLLARYKAQQEARDDYMFARQAIAHELVQLFEATIFGTLGENEFRAVTRNEQFRIGLAAWQLHGQVSHLIAVGV